MPTTLYNVNRILDRCPNYQVQDIVDLLNEIQTVVYSQDVEQFYYLDPSTGFPPFVVTTQGQYQYDCPANCRRTAIVFSANLPTTYSRTRPVGPRREYYFRNRGYFSIPVSQYDAIPDSGQVARIIFRDDPGDSTDKYYHLYWLLPNTISDLGDQLDIPPHLHYRIRSGVIAMLSSEQYGNSNYQEDMIDRLARKIRSEMHRGAQPRSGQTPWQEEFQEYPDAGYHGYRF